MNRFQSLLASLSGRKGTHYSGVAGESIPLTDHDLGRVIAGLMGAKSNAGIVVNDETAMRYAAVWACISLLSDTIGTLPLNLMRREGDDFVKDSEHPLNDLLKGRPNSFMTPTDFKSAIVANLCTNGFYVAQKGFDTKGRIAALNPLDMSKVSTGIKDGRFIVKYKNQTLNQDSLFIVRGFSVDGITPMSPIQYHREAIGLGLAAEKHGSIFFRNGGTPSVALELPEGMALKPEQRERLEKKLEKKYEGTDNAHKIWLLENGLKIGQYGLKNRDAQYIESRKLSTIDICSIFRVPPHMVGELERSTNNNIEHQARDLVKYTLNPYFRRIEEAAELSLLNPTERLDYRIKFNPEALLRGDLKSRSEGYGKMVQSGIMTVNEARRKENLPPVKGGDQLMVQGQMTPIDSISGDSNAND